MAIRGIVSTAIAFAAFAVVGAALTACGDQQSSATQPGGADRQAPTTAGSKPATLGPNGLGKLTLGMTAKKAVAAGIIEDEPWDGCGFPRLLDTNGVAHMSAETGVYGIYADEKNVRTPEGIGKGSDLASVQKAYPAGQEVEEGYLTPVPGNEKANYVFRGVDEKSPVDTMTLIIPTDPCATDDTLGDGK